MTNSEWVGVILAAGKGTRLAQSGISVPKPLAYITEKDTLLDLSYRSIRLVSAMNIYCITNSFFADEILSRSHQLGFQNFHVLVKDTRSAFFSFCEALSRIPYFEKFVATAVDSIAYPQTLDRAMKQFSKKDASSILLGVSPIRPSDRAPLIVDFHNRTKRVLRIGEQVKDRIYSTSGLYVGGKPLLPMAVQAQRNGVITLREFLRLCVEKKIAYAIEVEETVDIDTKDDLELARKIYHGFSRQQGR